MNRSILCFVSLLATLALGTPASAQFFTIEDIGGLPGSGDVEGWGINDLGQISGYYSLPSQGYLRGFRTTGNGVAPIALTDLGALPGRYSTNALGINNLGQVVGDSYTDVAGSEAIFRSSGNEASSVTLTDLNGDNANTQALSVNDRGEVTGASSSHAFRSSPNGSPVSLTDLGTLGSDDISIGVAINASGQVAGRSQKYNNTSDFVTNSFRSSPTNAPTLTLTLLPTLGGPFTFAHGINDSGQVVGMSSLVLGGAYHAFISSGNDAPTVTITDLGALGSDQNSSYAMGVNNQGWVVGDSFGTSPHSRAFLYTDHMIDLNTLIPAGSGVFLNEALDINNLNQIVAVGQVNGITHTYRLTPTVSTPEPGSILLFAAGGLVGISASRRKRARRSARPDIGL